jgi:hypothetical protein
MRHCMVDSFEGSNKNLRVLRTPAVQHHLIIRVEAVQVCDNATLVTLV